MVATRDTLLGVSDEEIDTPDLDRAELVGTPPTRKGRQQGPGGRHGKIPSKEPGGGRGGKRRNRDRSKAERQKGRLDARAFKELDTTLQVLGIDGVTKMPQLRVTRSPHAPEVAECPPSGTPHRSASGTWSPHRSASGVWSPRMGRTTSEAGASDVSLDSRESQLDRTRSRRGSLPPLHPSAQGQPLTPPSFRHVLQQSTRGALSAYRASGSLERMEEQAIARLQTERRVWHADLDHLLEGDFAREDLELAIHLARTKASDLKEQLRWWLKPPEPTWASREQRLDWLGASLEEARDIARGLQQHGALHGDPNYIATYIFIVKDIVLEFRGVSCVIGDAVSGAMRHMKPGDQETKRAYKCAHRCVDLIYELTTRLRSLERLMPEEGLGPAATSDLGTCAGEVVMASLHAATKLQDLLLSSSAFGFGTGDGPIVYGHELQNHARMLQSVWMACGLLVTNVTEHWADQRSQLHCEWCKLFLRAAAAADAMQGSLRRASTEEMSELDSMETPSASSGVWGSNRCFDGPKGGAVTDEDLQAQAWLPTCLMSMLVEAEKAAEATLTWEGAMDDYEGGGTPEEGRSHQGPPGGEGAGIALVDALSEAMYDLAHTGAKRVAGLCTSPTELACWALELLEEQACTAVVFVRDLDRGILGRGAHGLEHFERLRRSTDLLVNGILRVRRLLKQKRAADADEPLPPLPPSQPLSRYESTSSLASDWTSLSNTTYSATTASGTNLRPLPSSIHTPRYASPALAAFRPEPVGARPQQTQTAPPVLEVPQPRTPPQAQPQIYPSTLPHTRSSPPPPNPDPWTVRPPPAAVVPRPAAVVPRPAAASAAVAIPIPQQQQQASALPAHSVWGRAASSRRAAGSESVSAVSEAGSSPSGDDAAATAVAAAADRLRLERFAEGYPAAPGTATAASSRSSSPATDASLRVASRSPSFVFAPPAIAKNQLVGSPQHFPQMRRPAVTAQPAASAPSAVARPAAAPKPSPSQQASFRGWAKLFPEPAPITSSPTTAEDVVAAKFLEATSQQQQRPPAAKTAPPALPFTAAPLASPFAAPGMVVPLASPFAPAAEAAPRAISIPAPLASPFDMPTLQAASASDSPAFQSAPEAPSSSLGSLSHGPSSREQQEASPASSAQPSSSVGHARTDHDRHKEHRPSSGGWKTKFSRRSRKEGPPREQPPEASKVRSPSEQVEEEEMHGRKGGRHGRHKSRRSSLKEMFRGSSSHENGKEPERLPEVEEAAELALPEPAVVTPPKGVLARFKDAFTGASHTVGPLGPFDSAAAAAARQMGRLRHAARPVQEAAGHLTLSRDMREDEAWGKAPAAEEGTQREDKRGGRRKSRHRDRGRPGRGDRGRGRGSSRDGGRGGQPPTIEALAKRNGLIMPWEGDPFWEIDWKDLQRNLVRKLGNGSFGQVYEAYYHSAPMAVKIIKIDNDEENIKFKIMRFKEEVDLQRRLSLHPNIVRFLGACFSLSSGGPLPEALTFDDALAQQSITLAIVMELCRYGTLYKIIEYARRVSYMPADVRSGRINPRNAEETKLKAGLGWKLYQNWTTRLELAKQAAAGLAYMHAQNIVHRDLTSYNLLVTEKWECKLADFNLSRAIKETSIPHSGQINSPEWSAPERLSGQAYGKAADVFSFGVVLWELVTLMIPWRHDDKDFPNGGTAINGGDQHFRDPTLYVINCVPKGDRLDLPAAQDIKPPLPELPRVLELVQQCWAQDPAARPHMAEVAVNLDAMLAAVRERTRAERAHRA